MFRASLSGIPPVGSLGSVGAQACRDGANSDGRVELGDGARVGKRRGDRQRLPGDQGFTHEDTNREGSEEVKRTLQAEVKISLISLEAGYWRGRLEAIEV